MIKSSKGNYGGARPNSGPEPKPRAAIVEIVPEELSEGETVASLARQHTKFAVQTLALIGATGANEAARVSAIKLLMELAYGKPGAVATGAKEEKPADGMPGSSQEAEWSAILN